MPAPTRSYRQIVQSIRDNAIPLVKIPPTISMMLNPKFRRKATLILFPACWKQCEWSWCSWWFLMLFKISNPSSVAVRLTCVYTSFLVCKVTTNWHTVQFLFLGIFLSCGNELTSVGMLSVLRRYQTLYLSANVHSEYLRLPGSNGLLFPWITGIYTNCISSDRSKYNAEF